MNEALLDQGNDLTYYHPYTKGVNQRLVQPDYQRYIAGHPRFFNREQKAQALARQDFTCPICGGGIDMHHSECHHMTRFDLGGSSSLDNLIVVHSGNCHRMADAQGLANNSLIVGGTIYDAEPSQFRAGHHAPKIQKLVTQDQGAQQSCDYLPSLKTALLLS